MTERIYKITGNKLESLLIDNNALQFSSQSFNSVEDFRNAWNKKISLATKIEVKFDAIKSIKKEDDGDDIMIKYKGAVGIPSECEFSFNTENEFTSFFSFLENERNFIKTEERMSAIKSAMPYVFGLIITLGITIFAHFQSIAIANGTVDENGSRKIRMFNNIIEMIGDKGVLGIGILVTCFILYTIWKRFTNPPMLTTFLPK